MTRQSRRDPTTGTWVVISADRIRRPLYLEQRGPPPIAPAECPFCPGNEAWTGPAIDAVVRDGRWTARAVPNKYPALVVESGWAASRDGPYQAVEGFGAHEVLVECPEHGPSMAALPLQRSIDALGLARARMRDLARDSRFASLVWFRNHGIDAGASQAHPHAQLVGLPVVPRLVAEVARRGAVYWEARGTSLLADLVEHDRRDGARIVADARGVVTVCPWAPVAPFEVWIAADTATAHFRDADDAVLEEVASALHRVLGAITAALDDPPHQVLLVTAPHATGPEGGFRWHLRIRPRIEPGGGFEAGTAGAIVGVPPEEAARELRLRLPAGGS